MAKKRPAQKRDSAPKLAVQQTQERQQWLFRILVTALLLSVYGFYLAHQVNLTVGDLGRHLKNGQLFIETGLIPKINLYSYAYPDYPFINHHWGSGVVFYVIERLGGFAGLSVAFIIVSMVTFWIFINLATKYSSFAIAAPIAVIVLPILITRHEMRPELFSYLFSGLFLQVLWDYKYGRLGFRWLFILPILEIFWVNLHIYFFIGVVLIAVYLLESVVNVLTQKKQQNIREQVKGLGVILLSTIFAACLNPAGISGAIYPFLILNEYGMPVIENYSVEAILRAGYNFLPLIYFLIILGLLSLSWVYAVIKNRSSLSLGNFLLSVAFFVMAWSAIRNFALFAYFALPLAAVNLKGLVGGEDKTSSSRSILKVSAALAVIALVLVIIKPAYFVSSNRGRVGIGLEEANGAAGEFLLKEKFRDRSLTISTWRAISSITCIRIIEFLLTTGQKLIRRPFLVMSIFPFSRMRRNGQISVATMASMLLFLTIASARSEVSNLLSAVYSILRGRRSISIKILLFWLREMDRINRSSQNMSCPRKECWCSPIDPAGFTQDPVSVWMS